MKLAEIRFHTPIEFEGADGRKHVAQRFLAKDHDLRFLDDLGCLYIDGWHVSTQGARWLPAKEPGIDASALVQPPPAQASVTFHCTACPITADGVHALDCPNVAAALVNAEETDGGYQPGAPAGPAARRPKRR